MISAFVIKNPGSGPSLAGVLWMVAVASVFPRIPKDKRKTGPAVKPGLRGRAGRLFAVLVVRVIGGAQFEDARVRHVRGFRQGQHVGLIVAM